MRDHKARTTLHKRRHRMVDSALGTRVHARRRLVQNQDLGICQQDARNGEQLALTLADILRVVCHLRVIAGGHGAHKEVNLRSAGRGNDLFARSAVASVRDVLGNGAVK